MNNKTVKRESGTKPFRFKHQGHTVEIDEDIFKKRHHLDDVIRLNKTEFSGLKEIKEFLTHFNLQHCTHK
ncbi:hypothetical protein JW935_16160, partial [candidate division KSB1 bacterium]|nr:hypothetical protein [candidate division KSB1 bacterium]